jgi:hypothetical protein
LRLCYVFISLVFDILRRAAALLTPPRQAE